MCDKELLVAYLYDEIDPVERRTFENHLLSCGECRGELLELRGARTQLGLWAPPEPDLAFRIVRNQAAPAAGAWRASFTPAWGLAAAAVLVLAAASAIANVEVRYGAEGLVVRTGWSGNAPAAAAATAGAVPQVVPAAFTAETDSLKDAVELVARRVQELEAAAARPKSDPNLRLAATPVVPAEVLRQVRQIVAASEERQQQVLAMRIKEVWRDVDGRQRQDAQAMQLNLARVQQGLTDTTILRQRQIDNRVFRVGLQQPK